MFWPARVFIYFIWVSLMSRIGGRGHANDVHLQPHGIIGGSEKRCWLQVSCQRIVIQESAFVVIDNVLRSQVLHQASKWRFVILRRSKLWFALFVQENYGKLRHVTLLFFAFSASTPPAMSSSATPAPAAAPAASDSASTFSMTTRAKSKWRGCLLNILL